MHFNFDNPYRTTRLPVFARNVVSTSHPLAAQAGLHILRQGGNAVDAAIAAAAAMAVCEPVSNGLGSDAFCILWDGQRLHGLNASGPAPAAWTPAYFQRKYGGGASTPPRRGIDSVTVPGAVASWAALSCESCAAERPGMTAAGSAPIWAAVRAPICVAASAATSLVVRPLIWVAVKAAI